MQILFFLCVSKTGLLCLLPTNPNFHPESNKYTFLGKQYKLAHFFRPPTPSSIISKRSKKPEPKQTPSPHLLHPLAPLQTFKSWKSELRERRKEKAQPSIASHCIYTSSFHKHKVHCQKCLGQSLYFAWILTFVYQGNKPVLCCPRCKAIMKRHICISPHLRSTVCGTSCTVRVAGIYLQREAPEHRKECRQAGKGWTLAETRPSNLPLSLYPHAPSATTNACLVPCLGKKSRLQATLWGSFLALCRLLKSVFFSFLS